jgi:hypothetical protein
LPIATSSLPNRAPRATRIALMSNRVISGRHDCRHLSHIKTFIYPSFSSTSRFPFRGIRWGKVSWVREILLLSLFIGVSSVSALGGGTLCSPRPMCFSCLSDPTDPTYWLLTAACSLLGSLVSMFVRLHLPFAQSAVMGLRELTCTLFFYYMTALLYAEVYVVDLMDEWGPLATASGVCGC